MDKILDSPLHEPFPYSNEKTVETSTSLCLSTTVLQLLDFDVEQWSEMLRALPCKR